MKKELKQFLNFNGQNINVLTKDGTTWIAIKPICTALDVNYDRQYKNLIDDEVLSCVYAKQHTHDSINRLQEWYVYLKSTFMDGCFLSILNQSN